MADFDELYSAHYTSLTTQLYAYFGDRQEAQDVVQEAFCRALARWHQVSGYENPVAWVRKVAWNLATSHTRRLGVAAAFRRRHRPEHEPSPSPDRVALVTGLRALPATQRQAMVLHYLADLPIGEIARTMDVADGTVKSWLHRGRAALAAHLGSESRESDLTKSDSARSDLTKADSAKSDPTKADSAESDLAKSASAKGVRSA